MNSKNFNYLIALIIGMVIFTLPGLMMLPFSINYFDEPYQILNAIEWKYSVYSPFSSLLANAYGNIVGWEYLNFRYLWLSLTFITILTSSIYALINFPHKKPVILISWFCMLFSTIFKSDINLYGWDNWSNLFVMFSLLICISIFNKCNISKIIILGLFSGITALMRLPNLVIIPIYCIIFLFIKIIYLKSFPIRRFFVLYLFSSILTLILVLSLLYGNMSTYFQYIQDNPVGAHSPNELAKQTLSSLFYIFRFLILISILFIINIFANKILKQKPLFLNIVSFLIFILHFLLLIPFKRQTLGNIIEDSISFVLLSVFIIIKYASTVTIIQKDIIRPYAIIILLSGLIPAIGSNWGIFKYMSWPLLPLLLPLIVPIRNLYVSKFAKLISISLICFAVYGWWRPTYADDNFKDLNYQFKSGMLKGMRTSYNRGSSIDEIISRANLYIEAGYEIIPLRAGNDYIWEYIFMKRNELYRHKFNEWYAFNDENYISYILNHTNANQIILYLQWPKIEDNEVTLMFRRLNEEMDCLYEGRGYSIYKPRFQ